MRNLILSVLGVGVIVGSIFFAKYLIDSKNKPKPVIQKRAKTVFVEKVQNETVPIIVNSNGSLTAKRRVELFAEVQGIFKGSSRPFKEGQNFKAGQTLLRIDASEFAAGVQSQKSNLYNLIAAAIPDLRLDFPDFYPKWQNYLDNYDLNKPTPELPKFTSDKERYFITGRNILTTYYSVKNAEQRLAKYYITAPFSGVLTEALVTEGTLIRNGQKLGEFIDPSVYELEVTVNKSFAGLLKVGERVELTNLDKTQSWEGKIVRVNGRVNPQSQTISAFAEVTSDDLKEGMYLEALIDAKEEKNAIEIDRKLLLENQEVFVVKDSLLDVLPVKPVYYSDKKVVVKDIPDGTQILTRPVPGAYPGMLVKIYNDSSATNKAE
ncbi:RND family efflux transporter, MFP subunit [Zhouia amylolytica]|uniref:RND family efflux transporter, MFP subunit n=1 Tax=Zhouia amylolytica TaxID=376730 RepID=A0A1I6NZ26_9FLAO|nr:HlyD family efflux transporter periplasmic adaptor subunit [Zhouia amylolytica]SFS33201.1 RND family efflux transporter, MFP subunit [Zhouia amylolytica]